MFEFPFDRSRFFPNQFFHLLVFTLICFVLFLDLLALEQEHRILSDSSQLEEYDEDENPIHTQAQATCSF